MRDLPRPSFLPVRSVRVFCRDLLCLFALSLAAHAGAATTQALDPNDRALCDQLDQALDRSALASGRLRFEAGPVHSVTWTPVRLSGAGPVDARCASFEQAQADLDHPSPPSLVLRSRFCMKGTPSESLYVFPAESEVLSQLTWQNLMPIHETGRKIERTGGVYALKAISGHEAGASLRNVFAMDVVETAAGALVALTAPPYAWVVVGRMSEGESVEDRCYLQGRAPGMR